MFMERMPIEAIFYRILNSTRVSQFDLIIQGGGGGGGRSTGLLDAKCAACIMVDGFNQ